MRYAAAKSSVQPVQHPPGSYQLKPNGSRRTNTARVQSLTVPPPIYTANHDDVDGVRPVQRARGGQHDTLPTYHESLGPETLPSYNTNGDVHDNDIEACVAEQAPQRRSAVVNPRIRQSQQVAFILAAITGILIYLSITHWSR